MISGQIFMLLSQVLEPGLEPCDRFLSCTAFSTWESTFSFMWVNQEQISVDRRILESLCNDEIKDFCGLPCAVFCCCSNRALHYTNLNLGVSLKLFL